MDVRNHKTTNFDRRRMFALAVAISLFVAVYWYPYALLPVSPDGIFWSVLFAVTVAFLMAVLWLAFEVVTRVSRIRFSLRSLLIVMTLFVVAMAYVKIVYEAFAKIFASA